LIRWEAAEGKLTYYNFLHERPPDFSLTLYEDRAVPQGRIGVGFNGGLGRFDPSTGRYAFYGHEAGNPHSLPESGIKAVCEDDGGVLWLGSNGNGLFRYDPKAERFTKRRTPRGAAESAKLSLWRGNSLRAICETDEHQPWAVAIQSSHPQVQKLRRQRRLAGQRVQFRLLFQECERRAVLWRHRRLQCLLSRRHSGQSADQKVFSFEFAALDYTDPSKNQYAYKMENFDKDWQAAGTSRTATYTNLNPEI
jgi:hypothetical protein